MNRFKIVFILHFLVSVQTFAGFHICERLFSNDIEVRSTVSAALRNNDFVIDRGLQDYILELHKDFKDSLKKLRSDQTMIDLGGGKGVAMEEFLLSKPQLSDAADVVVITYKLGRFWRIPKYNGKFKILEKRLLEDIPASEIPRAKLMTDFFGVLSYTKDLSKSLQIIFDHLELGGELYTYFRSFETQIETPNGYLSLTRWLKTISGIQVEGKDGILKITKTSERVLVPEVRLTQIDEKRRPPIRSFSEL